MWAKFIALSSQGALMDADLSPDVRRADETAFGAMTWNVETLFRPQQGAADDERERYRKKLGLLAGVIEGPDPDAVALQEVGGEEELADLQAALGGATRTGRPRVAPTDEASGSPSSPSTPSRSKKI